MKSFFRRKFYLILDILIILAVAPGSQGISLAESLFTVQPSQIEIGAFFNGESLSVQAEIPSSAQAVIEIIGQNSEERLMKKGRRGGLWMNVGEIHVTGAPSLYIAASTEPQILEDPPESASWGYPVVTKEIKFSGQVSENEKEKLIQDFLKLKEHYGVYKILPAHIKNTKLADGHKKIDAVIPTPSSIKPGTYKVCLTIIDQPEKQKIAKKCQDLKVVMVGFPAILATLAYQHSALYGIMAVIIAIITGFAVGYVFKKGGGGGH
ncbi:MAG: TIGR02186 family protein [Thermodesulforhabdaceae bacterium]